MKEHSRRLSTHYDALADRGEGSLTLRLRDAYRATGRDPDRLTLDEIAGIDQLHLGGRAASRTLATLGALRPEMRVLDVGCGTGGASRLLADEFSCQALGVDITASFVEVAAWLSDATGLGKKTRFLCADAARTPLPDASFETVWCQHALMNMPDVAQVLAEWRRLLVPGGRVLLHEVVAGDNPGPLALPVPWASTPAESHLQTRADLERRLDEAGFELVAWEDVTREALAWRQKHSRREADEPPRGPALPGPGMIFGERFPTMGRNLRDNLAADKVRILAGCWRLR
uniref:class I SAM-dependent methyltransferase n=1 Tax=uncultured Halomonas sp. TaxID=173971 RepID=UPI002626B892|nr:class I SAM-dependent methyltransferase [uncultured Halomonas sp.]